MKRRAEWVVMVAAVAVVLAAGSTGLAQQSDAEARAAIQKVIDKINLAYTAEDPGQLFREILSDKAFALAFPRPDRPSEAVVLDKKTFCEDFTRWLKENRPKRFVAKIERLTLVGPLAYEIAACEEEDATGKVSRHKWLHIFAKEETGWKIVFSAPADDLPQALQKAF
jgi:hypothetical protein